jgi:Ca2+-binding EF-hand superfamily protein
MFGLMNAGTDRSDMRALVETEMFALLDADKDGAISDTEYAAANKREKEQLARKRAMFKMLDTNADGRLAQEEMPNPEKRLRALDTNNDGVVDRSEMAKMIKQLKQRKAAQSTG